MIHEKHIISLISSYLSKHDESEDMCPCGSKKGDPDHIEAGCIQEAISSAHSRGDVGGGNFNTGAASRMDTSGSAAQSVGSTATSDLGSLSGYERAMASGDW